MSFSVCLGVIHPSDPGDSESFCSQFVNCQCLHLSSQGYIKSHSGLIYFEIHMLGDILQANDDLSQVINLYKKIVEGQTMNGETGGRQTQTSISAGKFEV